MRTYSLLARISLCVVVGCVLLGVSSVGRADSKPMKPEAKALYDRGLKLYEQKSYVEAIAAFKQGQAIDPRPEFLYVLGQSERLRGDCKAAIPYYRDALNALSANQQALTQAELNRVSIVRLQLERCEKIVGPQEPEKIIVEKVKIVETPAIIERRVYRAWHKDPLGGALVGIGGASLVAGAALLGVGVVRADNADTAMLESSFADGKSSGKSLQIGGITLLAVGGVAALGGAVRWIYCKQKGCGPSHLERVTR